MGAGNHYGEVQVVDEIFDPKAAEAMGITKIGQVVLMVHCGSRGLGHQVATDALLEMEKVKVTKVFRGQGLKNKDGNEHIKVKKFSVPTDKQSPSAQVTCLAFVFDLTSLLKSIFCLKCLFLFK